MIRALALLGALTMLAPTSRASAQAETAEERVQDHGPAHEEHEAVEATEQETTDEATEHDTVEDVGDGIEPATTSGSSASGALGIVTILSLVGTLTGVAIWVERSDALGLCARHRLEDPPTRGCINEGTIQEQRDVGIGLTLGLGALALGAGVAWVLVATLSGPREPTEASVRCAPGLGSFACVGTF